MQSSLVEWMQSFTNQTHRAQYKVSCDQTAKFLSYRMFDEEGKKGPLENSELKVLKSCPVPIDMIHRTCEDEPR